MSENEILETQEKIKVTLLNPDGTLNIENLTLQIAKLQIAIRDLSKE